jgi:hypothetical protein
LLDPSSKTDLHPQNSPTYAGYLLAQHGGMSRLELLIIGHVFLANNLQGGQRKAQGTLKYGQSAAPTIRTF